MKNFDAKTKMKAMVVARLLMGDFDNWQAFEKEREIARQICNNQMARSVSAQIGKRYKDLRRETQVFISENFGHSDYGDLAKLCDTIPIGIGLYQRIDDFEKDFFRLTEKHRSRVPIYAHVTISIWGLQFEFPEHHFLRDLESGFADLEEIRSRLEKFQRREVEPKLHHEEVRDLVGRERFLSRSVISAAFSLVEAFLSGLFFVAACTKSIGLLKCDETFQNYAETKESAPLKDRLDRIVNFVSMGRESGNNEPFNCFVEIAKRYRDAIHHTTPFGRKDVEPGGRLIALYEINSDIALKCAQLSFETVLGISRLAYGDPEETDIGARCEQLNRRVQDLRNKLHFAIAPEN
jgi:hypothetical protein